MIKITEDQLDLLKEVFNLGVGRAAASLSKLANNKYEVLLSLPNLQIIPIGDMIKILEAESNNKITCVSQNYTGPFNGTAHMIYSHAASLRLVSIILDSNVPYDMMSDLESDALMEIGNVLINACLGALSKMFNEEIETELPNILSGTPEDVFKKSNPNFNEPITFIRSEFQIKEENLKGYISLFLETDKISKLLELIDKYNRELMGG
jgi:chemotaxis protein CheC